MIGVNGSEGEINPLGRSPVFSIVIAVKDAAGALDFTLSNINEQSTREFEIVIADAHSTDRPRNIISRYNLPIRHIVQSDAGIYDAWNKVIPTLKGEWVLFFGAGDTFFNADALTDTLNILKNVATHAAIVYGKVVVKGENGLDVEEVGDAWPIMKADISSFGSFPHQAMFHRRSSFDKLGLFDISLSIAADADMLLRAAQETPPIFVDLVIARFAYGGVSSQAQSRLQAYRERSVVLDRHGIVAHKTFPFVKAYLLESILRIFRIKKAEQLTDIYRRITGRNRRYK